MTTAWAGRDARDAYQQIFLEFAHEVGVLASSFILEAGGFDSPLAYPSGPNYSAHCAASTTSLVRAATLEPPLAHAPLPH